MKPSSVVPVLIAGLLGGAVGASASLLWVGLLHSDASAKPVPATLATAPAVDDWHARDAEWHALFEREQRRQADSLNALRAELAALRDSVASAKAAEPDAAVAAMPSADALEPIIMNVLQRERDAAAVEEMRRNQAQVAETAALSEGPYGAYNYRVNRMSRDLDLRPDQEAAYYDLLTEFAAEAEALNGELRQEFAWDGVGVEEAHHRIHEMLARSEVLDTEMQQALSAQLDPAQRQRFEALPPDRRGFGSSLPIAASDLAPLPR